MDRRKFIKRTVVASTASLVGNVISCDAKQLDRVNQKKVLANRSHNTLDDGKFSENVNVLDYGAVGDGVADDTLAIQAAISYAQTLGKGVFLPASTYLISGLILSRGIAFFGEGLATILSIKSNTPPTIDAIKLSPASSASSDIFGYNLHDFSIKTQGGIPGRHGIAIDITEHPVAYSRFTNIRVEHLGGKAFATLPNSKPLIDGFFTSTIDNCIFYGGIYLDKAGDSLRINNNTITGNNQGIYVDLVSGNAGGAHGLSITGNNISANGGALFVKNAWGGVFSRNNCEIPKPSGNVRAMVDIDGSINNLTNGFVIENNYLGVAHTGTDVIRINYARATTVVGNYVARAKGSNSYKITANAISTRIIFNIDALDETFSSMAIDNGRNTHFIREFGGDAEVCNNAAFTAANKTIKWVDSAGNKKACLGLSAIDDTFSVGLQTSAATNGHLLFFANGINYGRINPDGRWAVGYSGDPSAQFAMSSTTRGFLPPVMTTTQKHAISAPALGLIVFDSTLKKICVHVGAGTWQTVNSI